MPRPTLRRINRPSHPVTVSLSRRSHASRSGFSWVGLLVAVFVLGAGGYFGWTYFVPPKTEETEAFEYTVIRGDFLHRITERGEIQSAENEEVRCKVKGQTGQGVKILKLIVEEGTMVNKDDELAILDSSALKNELQAQEVIVTNANFNLIQAQNALDTATVAKSEYLEGTFRQEEQLIESEIFVARENFERAKEYLDFSQKLADRNYVTEPQLRADKFAVAKADKDVKLAETKLMALRNFTKVKTVMELDATIKTSTAQVQALGNTLRLEQDKLKDLKEQIENCVVKAPVAGEVLYANDQDRRRGNEGAQIVEGALVNENQIMFRLPDTSKMRARTKVNETRIGLVKPGMDALVRTDTYWDSQMKAKLSKVDNYPVNTQWLNTNVREYYAYVDIEDAPAGKLKSGMTCQVSLDVAQHDNVLIVPVQAVFEKQGKHYCLLKQGGERVEQPVTIGPSNDTDIVIRDGLKEGDVIIQNPRKFVEEEKPQGRGPGGMPGGFGGPAGAGGAGAGGAGAGGAGAGGAGAGGAGDGRPGGAPGGGGAPAGGNPGGGVQGGGRPVGPSAGGPSAGGPSAGGPSAGGPSAGGPSAGGPRGGAPSTETGAATPPKDNEVEKRRSSGDSQDGAKIGS